MPDITPPADKPIPSLDHTMGPEARFDRYPLSISVREPFCGYTNAPDVIHAARALVATEYLERGFVTPDEMDGDTISSAADPYVLHSEHYVDMRTDEHSARSRSGSGIGVAGTIRKIKFVPQKGRSSFPVLDHEESLYPEAVQEIYATGLEATVEMSNLVRDRRIDSDGTAALRLYRKAFHDSWNGGEEEQYIMACNPVLFTAFTYLFNGAFKRIGPNLPYKGQEAIPAMINLRRGGLELINASSDPKNPFRRVHRLVVDYFLSGANVRELDSDIVDALLENGFEDTVAKMRGSGQSIIQDDPDPPVAEIRREVKRAVVIDKIQKRKGEIVAGAGLLAYTALRTAGVKYGIDPGTDVDWRIFLGIEVATTAPYVWGMGDLTRSTLRPEKYSMAAKFRAIGVAATSLMAPYAYVIAEGGGMPNSAKWGVGAVAGLAVASAAANIRRRVKQERSKQFTETESPLATTVGTGSIIQDAA